MKTNYLGLGVLMVAVLGTVAGMAMAADTGLGKLGDGYNIYSPAPIMVNGSPRLYFGGWFSSTDRNDSIYAADCASGSASCTNVRKVIDAKSNGFEHLNDPTIITKAASGRSMLIMYMTGVPYGQDGFVLSSNKIYYSTSWADDGITWSKPELLMTGYWLPSATMRDGRVELYANSTTNGAITKFNLGTSGTSVGTPSTASFDNPAATPPFYSNVDVVWRPSLNSYQMLAERVLSTSIESSSVIDYLSSTDGTSWHLAEPEIVKAATGEYRVGTPAQWPDSAQWLFYGTTGRTDSTGFKVRFATWEPSNAGTPDPQPQASSKPDLTAGALSPTGVKKGAVTNLSATVANKGTGAANGFRSYVEAWTGQNGSGRQETSGVSGQKSVEGNGMVSVSVPLILYSASTVYARMCADSNGFSGTVSESNENNNCGAWTAIRVTEETPTPGASGNRPDITASSLNVPSGLVVGTPARLRATVANTGTAGASTAPTVFQIHNGEQVKLVASQSHTLGIASSASISVDFTFSYPGNYSIRACGDSNTSWTGVITENNEDNNCTEWTNVAVADSTTVAKTPDLAASKVTPSSGVIGTSITLNATVTNKGGHTNSTFPNVIMVHDGTNVVLLPAQTHALAENDSAPIYVTYTFPAVGTYDIRACADIGESWTGVITENNEDNNCGNWITFTVTDVVSGTGFNQALTKGFGDATAAIGVGVQSFLSLFSR